LQIIVAKNAGFCFGVKRAIVLAEQAAQNGQKVYSYGSLIHNPREIDRLEQKGIVAVSSVDQVPNNAVLLIRTHGAPPEVFTAAEAKGLEIIDATCPFVKKARQIACNFIKNGYLPVIVGDSTHPEVQGIVGWTNGKALVVADAQQASALPQLDKIGVLSQTTQTENNFRSTVMALKEKANVMVVENTICASTESYQQAAVDLAAATDLVLVIGGKNSSNTAKLVQVCKTVNENAYCINSAADLHDILFSGVKVVGITAGASTPDWIIEEVVVKMAELEKLGNGNDEEKINREMAEAIVASVDEEEENKEPEIAEEAVNETTDEAETEEAAEVDKEDANEMTADNQVEDFSEELATTDEEKTELATPEMSFDQEYGDMKVIRRGARVKGVVVQVRDNELLVDIGGKSEGILTASELTADEASNIREKFNAGDEIDVLILRKENQEGYPVLSKRRVDQDIAWEKLLEKKQNDQTVTGKVIEVVKGGVLVDVGMRGFVPASLLSLGFVEDLKSYIGKELTLKIIDCDKHSNKLVLSAKAILRKELSSQKQKTWEDIEEGQTRRGVVRRLTSFGAFIDIGGVDGLLHVSEMAWYRVNHPSDLLKEGDEIDVYVLSVDREKEKISLGLKQLVPSPWTLAAEKYQEGNIITAKVMRTTTFGAFLEVEPGVEGLVHISQLAHHRVEKTEDVVNPGDIVEVKVLSVDPEAKRMSLSIKAALPNEEEPTVEAADEEAEEQAMVEAAAVENDPAEIAEETVAEEPAVAQKAAEESAPAVEVVDEENGEAPQE